MGLIAAYKNFKASRLRKAIEKNSLLVKKPKAIREDRVQAIEFFSKIDDCQIAIPALLTRFDFSLEHGINDTREKESTLQGIIRFGAEAIPLIKDHLKKSDRIAWPIKCLKEVASDQEVIEVLEAILDYNDVALDQSKTEKNFDILCYLRDYSLAKDHPTRLTHFLQEHDERVRYAAVEVLLKQDIEEVQEKLEPFIRDDSAENTRIRQVIIRAFIDKKLSLKDKAHFAVGPFIPGVAISHEFILTEI